MGLRELVEFVGAKVAAPPFGNGKAQLQAAFFHHERQIAPHQLLLQGNGGAGHNQPFAAGLRHDATSQQIRQAFAHSGGAFNHDNAFAFALWGFFAFFLRFGAGKGIGDGGNHFALRGARAEVRQVFGKGAVMVADGVFFEFGEHGGWGAGCFWGRFVSAKKQPAHWKR